MFHSLMVWFAFLFISYFAIMFLWSAIIIIGNILCSNCLKNSSENVYNTGTNTYKKKEGFVSRYPIRKWWARPRGSGSRHFKTGYM